MNNIVDQAWENIFNNKHDFKKSGLYRAVVVETNDPMNMNRVRIIIPDFHDYDMNREYCPWAYACPKIGGRGSFFFVSPTIGDWVWIKFEKDDPYVPIYIGFASPLRSGDYSIQQIHTETLPVLSESGNIIERPKDYDPAYLPKDGRPMKTGWVDTYGNTDMSSAVGYFPVEHKQQPAPADLGPVDGTSITRRLSPPLVNDPDLKYMLRMSKYGHIFLMSDQGYYWQKPDTSNNESDDGYGEFIGDRDKDYSYESKRWLSVQRLLSEDDNTFRDRRRMLQMTRYGHVFDMRDVGWAQTGPIESRSREGEYGPRRFLSREQIRDQRFIRLRTKGGMYLIMGDRGFHPDDDKYIKRRLYDDLKKQDQDLEKYWGSDKDARFIGLMSRYGWKFILDDRGSHPTNADKLENPRGMGILLKGRRRPGTNSNQNAGRQSGYFFQIMEKDEMNSLMLGSPMGHVMEMNDKYQYLILSSTMGRKWSSEWKGFKEHEYVTRPTMSKNPERNAHHLKLDHQNEYVRLKTRGGRGPSPIDGVGSGVAKRDLQQGLEARDGDNGDGPWVELVDSQSRGIWMSRKRKLTILRGKKRKRYYLWFDEERKEIVLYNGEPDCKVRVYSRGSIDLFADRDINLQAGGRINMRASQVRMQSNAVKFTISGAVRTTGRVLAESFQGFLPGAMPGNGAQQPRPQGDDVDPIERPLLPEKIEPSDRGKTYNGPFEGIDKSELNPKIQNN